MKLGRLRSDHLAHDFPGYPKLAANRLDRLLLGEIRPTDLRDRLHYQHPQPGPHVPMEATVDPLPPGSRLDADHPENGVLIPCLFTAGAVCAVSQTIRFMLYTRLANPILVLARARPMVRI